MKIYNVAVIDGDEESEEYAVLAEDGQQARGVLAAFDWLSGKPPYQSVEIRETVKASCDGRAGVLEKMGERGTWS